MACFTPSLRVSSLTDQSFRTALEFYIVHLAGAIFSFFICKMTEFIYVWDGEKHRGYVVNYKWSITWNIMRKIIMIFRVKLILDYLTPGGVECTFLLYLNYQRYLWMKSIRSSNGYIFRVIGHLWRGALMFSSICAWIHGRVNNHEAGDLRRHRAHYDVTAMFYHSL